MKYLILTPLLAFWLNLSAQTFETIADGEWTNPLVWNLASVPGIDAEGILIHHNMVGEMISAGADNIVIDEGASVDGSEGVTLYALTHSMNGVIDAPTITLGASFTTEAIGEVTVNGAVSASSDIAVVNNHCIINGEVDCFMNFAIANSSLENHGSISSGTFLAENVENFGLIDTGSLATSMDLVNHSGAVYSCIGQMIVNGEIENDGDISSVNMTIGAINVIGNGGRFCIEECLITTSNFSGNLDVCDASQGSECDVYFGFIFDETVTFCAAGACETDIGISKLDAPTLSFYPNPAQNYVVLRGANFTLQKIKVQIVSAQGKIVAETALSFSKLKEEIKIDIATIPNGLYHLVVLQNTLKITERLVICR